MSDQRHDRKRAAAIASQIDDQLFGFARDDLVIGGVDRLDGVGAAHGVDGQYRGGALPRERHRAVAGDLRVEARITIRRRFRAFRSPTCENGPFARCALKPFMNSSADAAFSPSAMTSFSICRYASLSSSAGW